MIDAETFLKSYDSDSNPVIESVNESNAESDNENAQKCLHSALRIFNAAAQSCRSLEDKLEKKGFDRRRHPPLFRAFIKDSYQFRNMRKNRLPSSD